MSKLYANVIAQVSRRQFMVAAKQFLDDSNLSKKYWSEEDCTILHALAEKIYVVYNPQKKKQFIKKIDNISDIIAEEELQKVVAQAEEDFNGTCTDSLALASHK